MIQQLPKQWKGLREYLSKFTELPYIEIQDSVIRIDEVEVMGRQFLINIHLNTSKVEFIDDLVDLDRATNHYQNVNVADWKADLKDLLAEMHKRGFKFINTGTGNDDYMWYSAEIDTENFIEYKFIEATKLWTDFNKRKRNYLRTIL